MPTYTDLRSNQVDRLVTKDQDNHGRRTRNAADAILDQDYVTLKQLKQVATAIADSGSNAEVASGKTYSLAANGTIAIASDVCPRVDIVTAGKITKVKISLKTGPTGADSVFEIYQNTSLIGTLTIPDGQTFISATASQLAGYVSVVAGNYWRVDITQVGSTFPGADVVVTIGV